MTLHESQRAKMEALLAGDPPRFQGAAQCALRHRGRAAVAELQSDLSVRQRARRDHAADLADVRLQPDGLFLPHQLDADADGRRACAAGRPRRWPARRCRSAAPSARWCCAGGCSGTRFLAIAILFVIAVPVVGSIGYAGLTSTTALLIATFFAGALVLGIQSGINVVGAHDLSDLAARQRLRLAARHRPARRHRRPVPRRAVRRPSGRAALYVVGAAVRRRRGGDVHHLPAQQARLRRVRNWRRRSDRRHSRAVQASEPGVQPRRASPFWLRRYRRASEWRDIKTARSPAAPGSPSRRTAGSSAAARPPADRRN